MFRALDRNRRHLLGVQTAGKTSPGVPMSYMIKNRQYIARRRGRKEPAAELVALALPLVTKVSRLELTSVQACPRSRICLRNAVSLPSTFSPAGTRWH